MNSREICVSPHCAPQGGPMFTHPHIPDRSGFPSAVRGAGAARLGFPSAVCGTLGVAYPSHWAESTAGVTAKMITAAQPILIVLIIRKIASYPSQPRGARASALPPSFRSALRGAVPPAFVELKAWG